MTIYILGVVIALAITIGSIIAHEIAHGYVAHWLGDNTAKYSGRLSLNPIKHIDPIGSLLIPFLLLMSGSGLLFGWAKPVPINSSNFSDPQFDEVKVALAGPFTNFLLALIAALIARLLLHFGMPVSTWLYYAVQINLVLMLFNILPIPPLDGSRLLGLFLPRDFMATIEQINPIITLLLLLVVINSGIFSSWLGTSVTNIANILLGQ